MNHCRKCNQPIEEGETICDECSPVHKAIDIENELYEIKHQIKTLNIRIDILTSANKLTSLDHHRRIKQLESIIITKTTTTTLTNNITH